MLAEKPSDVRIDADILDAGPDGCAGCAEMAAEFNAWLDKWQHAGSCKCFEADDQIHACLMECVQLYCASVFERMGGQLENFGAMSVDAFARVKALRLHTTPERVKVDAMRRGISRVAQMVARELVNEHAEQAVAAVRLPPGSKVH